MPGLIYDSVKFTASAWFSPLPTGYCITKNNFLKSIEQANSMLETVHQCAQNQLDQYNHNEEFEEEFVTLSSAPVA